MAYTEAQKRATMKYMKEKLHEIRFRVPKDQADKIKAHAEHKGMSLRAYILDLIEKDMNQ